MKFVENGGGLLICGTGITNYHTDDAAIRPLLKRFGTKLDWLKWLRTDTYGEGEDLLNVACRDMASHPVTTNVSVFKTSLAGVIRCDAPGADVLVSSPADCNLPQRSVAVTFPYGQGKVIVISDSWWLRPLNIDLGDNAQLWLNMVNYLAGRPCEKLSPSMRARGLFITAAKLAKAEAAEQDGPGTLKPFSARESALSGTGKARGIAGGDPILDAFN
jgi:uncharacterized membrane protein